MYKFHMGHTFKNSNATIFVTQLLNDKGESVAEYDLINDILRTSPLVDSTAIFKFMNQTKRAYKQFIKESK